MNIDLKTCNWYNKKQPERGVMTFRVACSGFKNDTVSFLLFMGFTPVYYNIPDYDKRLYQPEAIGGLNNIEAMKENDDGVLVQEFELVPLELSTAKNNCIQPLAEARYNKEIAGTEITGIEGITTFSTTREIRSKISELISCGDDVDYKTEDGSFVHLTHEQLVSLLNQINTHVQSCYSKEKKFIDAINACNSVEELSALDLTF